MLIQQLHVCLLLNELVFENYYYRTLNHAIQSLETRTLSHMYAITNKTQGTFNHIFIIMNVLYRQ